MLEGLGSNQEQEVPLISNPGRPEGELEDDEMEECDPPDAREIIEEASELQSEMEGKDIIEY